MIWYVAVGFFVEKEIKKGRFDHSIFFAPICALSHNNYMIFALIIDGLFTFKFAVLNEAKIFSHPNYPIQRKIPSIGKRKRHHLSRHESNRHL